MIIKKLRKGDRFQFNNNIYYVIKKYIDDDHPLKAVDENRKEQLFHNEELEVIILI